jgi:hypothetical protein
VELGSGEGLLQAQKKRLEGWSDTERSAQGAVTAVRTAPQLMSGQGTIRERDHAKRVQARNIHGRFTQIQDGEILLSEDKTMPRLNDKILHSAAYPPVYRGRRLHSN